MIQVKIYGQIVGYLAQEGRSVLFEYDRDFINSGLELSPFLLPLRDVSYSSIVSADAFKGLPHFISDALPDAFGNKVIDSYFAKKGIAKSHISLLERLSYVGEKSIGALEFEPAEKNEKSYSSTLEVAKLVKDARSAINGELTEVSDELISIGSSAGGARPKALIGLNKDFSNVMPGHHEIPSGYKHYLIKFDGVDKSNVESDPLGYTNIEYVYSILAEKAGINMNPCFLIKDNGRAHFLTERFDRKRNEKLHVQTLCALTGIDFNDFQAGSYSDYFSAVVNLGLSNMDREQAFRRMVFNIVMVNRDDHTKNFSFTLDRNGKWGLAPAYDITHAYNEINPNAWTREHNLLINGKGQDITLYDIIQEAEILGIKDKRLKEIVDEIVLASRSWLNLSQKHGVLPRKIEQIESHIKQAVENLSIDDLGNHPGMNF